MLDSTTNKPLYVSTDGTSGPYIIVPLDQVSDVRALLDGVKVPYWVDEEAISIDGKAAITVVNLGRNADPETASKALDEAN